MPLVKDKAKSAIHRELLANPKVQAILKTIRYAEGTSRENGYGTRVGGGQFSDFSKKPSKKVYIKSIGDYSSAEGAYQFLDKTWSGVSQKLGLTDFSPESQDIAAVDLIIQRGAINDVLNDNFKEAINKLSPEWASLPKSSGEGTYKNQKAKKIDQLAKVFYDGKQMSRPNQITPNLIDLSIPNQNSNLASVPEQEEPKEVVSAKEELQQKQNEENFIADLYANAQQEEAHQPVQLVQPQQTNVLEKYAQIESFVDAQQGGTIKRPVYVESKNDQRYRAYQDSLNLYNAGEQEKKQLKGLREYPYDKSDDLRVTDSKAYEAFKRTGILPTTENAGSYRKEGADFTYGYKKPTQPVLFTPQHRALQHPIQKLNPTGLQEFQQELPSADYTIQQVTQQPKYYDVVDKVNQNFGGVESSYKWYPENGIPLQPLSQEKYQDGTPYNTRAMIPYYQEGGKIFNPNLSNQKDFQEWYKLNTIEGKNNIPYSEQLDYDYLSFFKNKDYLTYKGGHFPDKYKRPIHETFSNESLYSTPENPGGYWQGEQYSKNGKFAYQSGGNIPISSQGVYEVGKQEVIVPTRDGRITMKNINYPILGQDEFGNKQLMQPNQEYQFQGKTIHEIPQLTTQEKSFLKEMQKYKR